MLVHFGVDLIEAEWTGSTVCIGMFDGVHLGHQALIKRTVELAKQSEHPSIILTFDRHPSAVLAPDKKPLAIGTLEQNVRTCRIYGASLGVVMKFDHALSQTSASDFLEQILRGRLKAKKLVVGHDFALGRGREGTGEWLSQHIETEIVGAVELEGKRVSSSEIRRQILAGAVTDAAQLLSRPFCMAGIVVGGQKMGRQLGWPTLNLARGSEQVVPKDGVYAGFCRTPFGVFKAAISIGMRPAVQGTHRTIEAYLLDYPGDSLYSVPVELGFKHRIRDEANFDSLEDLKQAIASDVEKTAQLVNLD